MQSLQLQGPAGRLDVRVHGEGPPVLLLHPHPQWGGTMGSRLVYDLAVGLSAAGFRAVRFDFRGAGRSEGLYAQGLGEADDAVAVFDWLAGAGTRAPGGPGNAEAEHANPEVQGWTAPAVVGYSFGGAVACRLATQRRPARLVLVGTPLRVTESVLVPEQDAPQAACPAAIVVGDRDGFVPVADAHRLAAAFPHPAPVAVVPGAGHFLEPSRNAAAVAAVLAQLRGPLTHP